VNTFLTGSSGTIGRNFSGTIAKLNVDLSQNGSFAIPELIAVDLILYMQQQ
jgi:hypothetical protein